MMAKDGDDGEDGMVKVGERCSAMVTVSNDVYQWLRYSEIRSNKQHKKGVRVTLGGQWSCGILRH